MVVEVGNNVYVDSAAWMFGWPEIKLRLRGERCWEIGLETKTWEGDKDLTLNIVFSFNLNSWRSLKARTSGVCGVSQRGCCSKATSRTGETAETPMSCGIQIQHRLVGFM